NNSGSPEEGIPRIQKFAEVPLPHQQRRHRAGGRTGLAKSYPLLSCEEEELVSTGIKFARNENGSANRVPGLVETERRSAARVLHFGTAVPDPGIRIERGIPEKLIDRSVEVPGSAFRHKTNLAILGSPILSRIGRSENLDFLDRVRVEYSD